MNDVNEFILDCVDNTAKTLAEKLLTQTKHPITKILAQVTIDMINCNDNRYKRLEAPMYKLHYGENLNSDDKLKIYNAVDFLEGKEEQKELLKFLIEKEESGYKQIKPETNISVEECHKF